MNDDTNSLHPWIAPELEARLTALVLGEASDFERDELDRLIAERPELALYRERLETMHCMLREVATGESGEEQGEWRLSGERRSVVIAQLSGKAPGEEAVVAAPRRNRPVPWGVVIRIAACIAVIALLLGLMFPATTGALRVEGMKSHEGEEVYAYEAGGQDRLGMKPSVDDVSGSTTASPALPAEPMVVTRSGQNSYSGGTTINSGGVVAITNPDPVAAPAQAAAAPASGPSEASEEVQLTKLGAGTLALNEVVIDLERSNEVVEFDGFIDYKQKSDAAASAPGKRGDSRFTGDLQVNSGIEARTGTATNSRSFGSGGVIAGASEKKESEGFGFESPVTLDGLRRAAGVAGQEGDVSRMARSSEVGKSMEESSARGLDLADADRTKDQVIRRELPFAINQSSSFTGTVNFGAGISQIQDGVADVDKSVQGILALTPQANLVNGEDLSTLHASTEAEGRFRMAAPVAVPSHLEAKRKALLDEVAANWESPAPATLAETSPSAEPFSTFSLHVSDVSFQLAKAALASGKWPEAEKIRIEEFVNAFDYGDPMPGMGERVACRIDQAAHPFLQQRHLVRIALRTAEAGRSSGTPLRLTLLLDSSGSMERPDRRETVRRAVATLAGLLGENDRITLISFARTPRLVADAVAGNEAMKLAGIVAALPSEGGTNLEAALQLAFEKAREHQEPNAQNRIVLLTDGAANLGDANAGSLASLVAGMREAGIAFDAAGFGAEGLNDEILEALTRKGDGRYYLLDRPEDADEGFAKQIAGALRPAAKNVKVQVEFNPDRVKAYKLLGFEKHRLATEDFRNDIVDAAEMAAAEAGVAVYQVEPMPGGEGDLGSVSVRFRDLDSGEMVERRWSLPYLDATLAVGQGGEAIDLATVASQFAVKLAGGPLGDVVDLGELARLAAKLPEGPRVKELRTMIEQARGLEADR